MRVVSVQQWSNIHMEKKKMLTQISIQTIINNRKLSFCSTSTGTINFIDSSDVFLWKTIKHWLWSLFVLFATSQRLTNHLFLWFWWVWIVIRTVRVLVWISGSTHMTSRAKGLVWRCLKFFGLSRVLMTKGSLKFIGDDRLKFIIEVKVDAHFSFLENMFLRFFYFDVSCEYCFDLS